jgi:hypothetical protein
MIVIFGVASHQLWQKTFPCAELVEARTRDLNLDFAAPAGTT